MHHQQQKKKKKKKNSGPQSILLAHFEATFDFSHSEFTCT